MDPEKAFEPTDQPTKWYYRIFSVLLALFLFGPLVFPLLWKSPCFNRFWKITITVLVTISSIYMIYKTWDVVTYILDEIKRAGLIQ